MARFYDPHENTDRTTSRQFKIGGMKHPGAAGEVVDTITQIDGVISVGIDEPTQKLFVEFDQGKISEEHLISTLNSLGHSILKES